MQPMQASCPQTPTDRAALKAQADELAASNNPVLATGKRRDLPIGSASLRLCPNSGPKCRFVGHGPEDGLGGRARVRQT
jgi:hypothetical protein